MAGVGSRTKRSFGTFGFWRQFCHHTPRAAHRRPRHRPPTPTIQTRDHRPPPNPRTISSIQQHKESMIFAHHLPKWQERADVRLLKRFKLISISRIIHRFIMADLQSKVNQLTSKIQGELTTVVDELERYKLRPIAVSYYFSLCK